MADVFILLKLLDDITVEKQLPIQLNKISPISLFFG